MRWAAIVVGALLSTILVASCGPGVCTSRDSVEFGTCEEDYVTIEDVAVWLDSVREDASERAYEDGIVAGCRAILSGVYFYGEAPAVERVRRDYYLSRIVIEDAGLSGSAFPDESLLDQCVGWYLN